jgi:hypothetical protein
MKSISETILDRFDEADADNKHLINQNKVWTTSESILDRFDEIEADNKHLINQNKVWKIKCEKLEAVVNGDTYNIKRLSEENEKLKIELQEANDYADRLVEHKDMVCLPADLANLREANARFASENAKLKEGIKGLSEILSIVNFKIYT